MFFIPSSSEEGSPGRVFQFPGFFEERQGLPEQRILRMARTGMPRRRHVLYHLNDQLVAPDYRFHSEAMLAVLTALLVSLRRLTALTGL